MCDVCRRSFMRGAAAFGAAGLFSSPLMAQAGRDNTGVSKLPARGEFTIANAYVMTMDSGLGDIADGSVHVRNGEIVAVGTPEDVVKEKRSYTGHYLAPLLAKKASAKVAAE